MTIRDIQSLRQAVWATIKTDPTCAPIDVEELIAFGCKVDRQTIRTRPTIPVSPRLWNQTLRLAHQRAQGTPTPLITGQTIFYGLTLQVERKVLLPRPETELLVETVLEFLSTRFNTQAVTLLELGVGTGAISLAVAHHRAQDTVLGWDVSRRAVRLAQRNLETLKYPSVCFAEGDFFAQTALWAQLSMTKTPVVLVSNPPYIPTHVVPTLDNSVLQNDPKRALDGGASGLVFHRKLLALAATYQWPLFLEIGYDQDAAITQLAEGIHLNAKVICDYGGYPRVASILPRDPIPL